MVNYAPRPGSAAEAAVEYLRKKGGPARSGEIAKAIGIESKGIAASLSAVVENGVLVVCDVQVPGSPPQKEYRLSGGGKPIAWREPKPARAPVAAEAAPPAEKPARKARKPRKAPKPAPAHPRGPKVTGRLLTAAAKVQRKTAKRLPVTEVPWKAEQPVAGSLARLGHPRGTGLRFGVFNDGTLEIVLADGQRVEIAAPDARRLVEYLDRSLLREAA